MNDHITGPQFASFIDSELNSEQRLSINLHLESCSICSQELERFQEMKIRLNRLPYRTAPQQLITNLKNQWGNKPTWIEKFRQLFIPRLTWRPVAAMAFIALIVAVVLINKFTHKEEEYVDMDSLLVAHAKYQGEAMVPEADMSQSNYSMRLASFYRDEN